MSFNKGNEKEIFLHVGLHKTGTTSIQDTLHLDCNNNLLGSKGYIYPKCWPSNHSIPIYSSFCDDPKNYHINIRNKYTADQITSLNEKYLIDLKTEINERQLAKLIISGEDISLLSVNNLNVFKEYLNSTFTNNIKVIIYVRNPVEWAVSAIQQFIKNGRENYKNAVAYFEKIIENLFLDRIEKFAHVFGREFVNVYSFEKAVLNEFGLVGHFLSTIGMNDKEISEFNLVTANEGISLIAGDIISYINEKMPLFRDGKMGKHRSDGDTIPLWKVKGPKFDILYSDKQKILEHSRNDIEWLNKNWGIDYSSVELLRTNNLNFDLSNEKVEEIKQATLELSPALRSLVLEYLQKKAEKKIQLFIHAGTSNTEPVFGSGSLVVSEDESENSEKVLAERFEIRWSNEQVTNKPNEVFEFLIVAELGILEVQAIMLCESIRQFGGRYSQAGIAVISPRPDRRPTKATLQRLESLGVKYIPLSIVSPCPDYGTSFNVLALAEYEKMSTADILVGLDSGTVFLAEPDLGLGNDDAAARPISVKGFCSIGAEDPQDAYLQNLCSLCGVDYNLLPYVITTVDRQTVKASYHVGFVIVRRICKIFQRTADYFLQSVQAGYGLMSVEGSEYWGSSEACLSLAIWGAGMTVRTLPPGYNFPLTHYTDLRSEVESGQFGELTHIHYHHLLTDVSVKPPEFLDYLGYPEAGIAWLKGSALLRFQQTLVYIRELEIRDSELTFLREELEKIYSSNGWRILLKYYELRDSIRRIIRKLE